MILASIVFLTIINLRYVSMLFEKKMRKEIYLYLVLTALNFILGICITFEIDFPTPKNAIEMISNALFGNG